MENLKVMENLPKLVNIENFKVEAGIKNKISSKPVKWNLNKIILILFGLFLIFFLYNCKYGIFKYIENDPVPYSLIYNFNS